MRDLQVRFNGLKMLLKVKSCQIGLSANWCLKGSFLYGCQESFPLLVLCVIEVFKHN